MDQITKFEDVTKSEQKKKISLVSCRPDWIPDLEFDLLCPNETIYMSGALYQTDKFEYGRIKVNYCKGTNCLTGDELAKITSGGRILLFI